MCCSTADKGKLTVERDSGEQQWQGTPQIERYLVAAQSSRTLKRSSPKMLDFHTLSMSLHSRWLWGISRAGASTSVNAYR